MVDTQRYGRPNRRTPELPMAFSAWEFIRGALLAWLAFLLLAPIMFMLAVAVIGVASFGDFVVSAVLFGLMGVITIFPWAIAALIVSSPLAFLLGQSLRRVTSISVHLLLFAAFGLLLGVVSAAVATPLINLSDAPPSEYGESILDSLHFVIGAVLASTVAIPLGWWLTARVALRADARRSVPAPVSAWEQPAA